MMIPLRSLPTRLWLLLALGLPLGSAEAQSVAGTVRDAEGRPVPAALVVLVAGGERVGGTISDAGGAYRVAAPAPGEYTLLVERIGYAAGAAPAVLLKAGETRHVDLTVAIQPASLAGVTATGRSRRCRVRPDHAPEIQRVWDAARRALTATALTRDLSLVRWRAVDHVREIDPITGEVRSDTQHVRPGWGTEAYVSAPAEELRRRGFVWTRGDTVRYLTPDASVLLSDWFQDTHCFRLEPGEAGTIGLAFEPVRSRRVPDIAGVMWLDVATGHLLSLDFRYTRVRPFDGPVLIPGRREAGANGSVWVAPRLARTAGGGVRAGGRVEFERLDGGGWIIRRWNLRVPRTLRYLEGAETRTVLGHIHEEGGVVVEVETERKAPPPRARERGRS